MMNILVVSHFQGDGLPTATFVHDQVKALHKLGHNIRVIVPIAFGKRDYYKNRFSVIMQSVCVDEIEYIFLRYLSLSQFASVKFQAYSAILILRLFAEEIIKDFKPQIIHAHTLGFDSEIGAWLKKQIVCPLVVTTHGSDTNIPYAQGKMKSLKSWCEKTDAVVCVSKKLEGRLISCRVKAPITTIHNGFNDEFIVHTAIKKRNTIIQVGNLVPSKRVDITIQAFSLIKKSCPTATLTIVGDGPEKEKLLSLCKELKIENAVSFTGRLSNREVLKRMAESEFFVMVSSPEGFGIVYLEAMASKCVTIATENEGIADIIEPGENGFLLPLNNPKAISDKIISLMGMRQNMYDISQQGFKDAIRYSWKENVLKYQELYDKLVRGQVK